MLNGQGRVVFGRLGLRFEERGPHTLEGWRGSGTGDGCLRTAEPRGGVMVEQGFPSMLHEMP